MDVILSGLGVAVAFLGLFGWSHSNIKAAITQLERDILKRPTEDDVKELIKDKLDVTKVEFKALANKLDELRLSYDKLGNKLDKAIEALAVLNASKNKDAHSL